MTGRCLALVSGSAPCAPERGTFPVIVIDRVSSMTVVAARVGPGAGAGGPAHAATWSIHGSGGPGSRAASRPPARLDPNRS